MEKQSHEYAAVPIDPEAGVDAPRLLHPMVVPMSLAYYYCELHRD